MKARYRCAEKIVVPDDFLELIDSTIASAEAMNDKESTLAMDHKALNFPRESITSRHLPPISR